MNIKFKSAIVGVLAVSVSVMANIRQTIFKNFHYLYVDFATSTAAGHQSHDTDAGNKYMELALNGNTCYDIHLEASNSPNPDIIFKIGTSSGEQTLDDDGPTNLMPQALLWITAPTLLKVRAYSASDNSADFMVYSTVTTATSASTCKALDSDRPFFNGATSVIERGPSSAD